MNFLVILVKSWPIHSTLIICPADLFNRTHEMLYENIFNTKPIMHIGKIKTSKLLRDVTMNIINSVHAPYASVFEILYHRGTLLKNN